MVLRQLEYLVALAREKHFGRAAEVCHVTQPTLSAAIRLLEEDLGAPIVERGHRFVGLTRQGELALQHAHRILAEAEVMRRDIETLDKGLSGRLRLGAVPTALPIVSHLTAPFIARYPQVTVTVLSLNSQGIQRGIEAFELDVGVTYLDNEPLERVQGQADLPGGICLSHPRIGPLCGAADNLLERGRRRASMSADAGHAEPAHH